LSAGIYAGRAKLNAVIVEESVCGGQAATTSHIANYPGTPGAVNGKELTGSMKEQAVSFGTRVDDLKEIFELRLTDPVKYVRTEDTEYYAKALILATGARPKALDAIGAIALKGRGIHYCATCDGAMYEGANVIVVGGGSAALEEAVYLTKFADHVTIIHRREEFRGAATELEEARANEKISILTNKIVLEVIGGEHVLQEAVIQDVKTGQIDRIKTDGAFIYVGNEPQTQMFKDQIKVNDQGFIAASEDTKTSAKGVFAAGDVRTKEIRQVVTAVSDGAAAAIMAEKYIASLE
ncbi:MAG: FAD-dependent oxidoreductase, partial [Bacillota bacterium]